VNFGETLEIEHLNGEITRFTGTWTLQVKENVLIVEDSNGSYTVSHIFPLVTLKKWVRRETS
jgi:hypothetical protein